MGVSVCVGVGYTMKREWLIIDALLFIAILIMGVLGIAAPFASLNEQCLNPPAGNPNKCHLYTWNPFPLDTNQIAPQGLFNNDTSYYKAINGTGIVAFNICAHVMAISNPGGNATLTLQYMSESTDQWQNADNAAGETGLAGALVLNFNGGPESDVCSQQLGLTGLGNCGLWVNGITGTNQGQVCSLRIAGNMGVGGGPFNPVSVTLSSLHVQLFQQTTFFNGQIVCSRVTITTSSFTTRCTNLYTQLTNQAIAVAWRATNSSGVGAGCGAADNCIRSGTFTCTINAGANFCSVSTSFSPAFTGTPYAWVQWNIMQQTTTITQTPSQILTFLD